MRFTLITGKNNTGKTALIEGLMLKLSNKTLEPTSGARRAQGRDGKLPRTIVIDVRGWLTLPAH
ncbi:ATP-binding protein [Corallococcus terminator]|uniref:ATP-binding protein n=1 Tax=Corallococcus terminator TaxID=2316733 RepID=UPI0011C47853|nr:ATP-binding protein [Corallococcus terminator]